MNQGREDSVVVREEDVRRRRKKRRRDTEARQLDRSKIHCCFNCPYSQDFNNLGALIRRSDSVEGRLRGRL